MNLQAYHAANLQNIALILVENSHFSNQHKNILVKLALVFYNDNPWLKY